MTEAGEEARRISLFEAVGGEPYFEQLVAGFFERVERTPILRTLYPEDLAAPARHTALFLIQYWGGPGTYRDERGHPRLRMRHMPFAIGQAERDAWVQAMLESLAEVALPPEIGAEAQEVAIAMQTDYFEQAGTAMINQP